MGNITDYLKQILSARYGKDVRQAIHDGIQQCYYDGKAGEIDLQARQDIESLGERVTNETSQREADISALNESLGKRNLQTFTDISQIGGSTANTVTELLELLPVHSLLKTNVTQNTTNLNNSLPNVGIGQLILEKETAKRGRATFTNYQTGDEFTAIYYNTLGAWEQTATNSDLAKVGISTSIGNLTLASGVSDYHHSQSYLENNTVHFSTGITVSDNTQLSSGVLFTISEGYRGSVTKSLIAINVSTKTVEPLYYNSTNGQIAFWNVLANGDWIIIG